VNLLEVTDTGISVNDPAGMRIAVDGGALFLHPGSPADRGGEWLSRIGASPKARETALRRAAINPTLLAVVQAVIEIVDEKDAAAKLEKRTKFQKNKMSVLTGERNFYALNELAEYHCVLRDVLKPKAPAG